VLAMFPGMVQVSGEFPVPALDNISRLISVYSIHLATRCIVETAAWPFATSMNPLEGDLKAL